jgi:hypothetical protein
MPGIPNIVLRGFLLMTLAAVSPTALAVAAPAKVWTPAPYKPHSKRDFTGVWERVAPGATWDPAARGVTLSAPLAPAYQAIFDQRLKAAAIGKPTADTTASCLPQGMPRFMTMPYPMEILQNGTQINIFAEWNEQTRRIWVDGRPHPSADELDASYNGHSIGHWEGNTLIADTVGVRPEPPLEASGLPHSDVLGIAERIRLASDNTLIDEITLNDAKAYTRPWTVTKIYKRMPPGSATLPFVCLENQRNPVNDKGETMFIHEGDNGAN